MEINITKFFNSTNPIYYSASCAELGDDAGRITWENAVECAEEEALLSDDDSLQEFREYVKTFGAWSDDEISAWSNAELNALLIQIISGDMREADLHPGMTESDWREYETGCEEGRYSGRIYGGPLATAEHFGKVFYYIGE